MRLANEYWTRDARETIGEKNSSLDFARSQTVRRFFDRCQYRRIFLVIVDSFAIPAFHPQWNTVFSAKIFCFFHFKVSSKMIRFSNFPTKLDSSSKSLKMNTRAVGNFRGNRYYWSSRRIFKYKKISRLFRKIAVVCAISFRCLEITSRKPSRWGAVNLDRTVDGWLTISRACAATRGIIFRETSSASGPDCWYIFKYKR